MERTLARLACELDEHNRGTGDLVLFGIVPQGILVARALARYISEIAGRRVDPIPLDLRADSGEAVEVSGKQVVVVDDVLHTGRTAHRGVDAVCKMGEPARIQLMVLIDRGHREMAPSAGLCWKKNTNQVPRAGTRRCGRGLSVYLEE